VDGEIAEDGAAADDEECQVCEQGPPGRPKRVPPDAAFKAAKDDAIARSITASTAASSADTAKDDGSARSVTPSTAASSTDVTAGNILYDDEAGLAPYPKPSRAPPLADGEDPSDVKAMKVSTAVPAPFSTPVPAQPMPKRKPPAAPTRPPPSAASASTLPKREVPQEALTGWGYWTTPDHASAPPPPVTKSAASRPAPPRPSVPSRLPPQPLDADREERLPEGWQRRKDPKTGCTYYFSFERHLSQWESPQSSDSGGIVLPPGWRRAWCSLHSRWFYINVESEVAQWNPPEAYVHRGWRRQIDNNGHAYWVPDSAETAYQTFYESDKAWQRVLDLDNRPYWSNAAKGIRFFEVA
jgi:hypothetical protein